MLKLAKSEYIQTFETDDPFDLLTARRYRGAAVEVFERGIHRDGVTHVDVRSMYPMVMVVLNLSPESLRLVRIKPLTGQYILTPRYIEVPDETLKKQLVMEVAEEDSISRKLMLEFYERRQEVRKERTKAADSKQQAFKLIMNSTYGYNGMEWARYGSFLVAIVTASVGRFIIRSILGWLRQRKLKPLEMDTDGIYVAGEFDVDELIDHVRSKFGPFPLRDKLTISAKRYDGMIVAKMKNYVLRNNNTNVFKGSGFRGRNVPRVCELATEEFASALFEGKDLKLVWKDCLGLLHTTPLKNFEMCIELSKSPEEYSESSLYSKLFKQLPSVDWGDEIRYVACAREVEYVTPKTKQRRRKMEREYIPLGVRPDSELLETLDRAYYQDRMKDAVARLVVPLLGTDAEVDGFYSAVLEKKKRGRRKKASKGGEGK